MNRNIFFSQIVQQAAIIALTFCGSSSLVYSQNFIDVHQEGFHKPIYSTEHFRILEVHLNPSDTSDFHVHNTPIIYLSFSECRVELFETDKAPRIVTLPDGWIGSDYYTNDTPFVHKIAPALQDSLRIIAFQLKEVYPIKITNDTLSNAVHNQNGFVVKNEVDLAKHFDSPGALPLLIRGGVFTSNDLFFARGSIFTYEDFLLYGKEEALKVLSFWEVEGHFEY